MSCSNSTHLIPSNRCHVNPFSQILGDNFQFHSELMPGAPGASSSSRTNQIIEWSMLGVFGVCLAAGAAGSRSPGEAGHYPLYINTYHKKKQKTANFTGINIISQSIYTSLSHSIFRFTTQMPVCQPKIFLDFRHYPSAGSPGAPGAQTVVNPHYLSFPK